MAVAVSASGIHVPPLSRMGLPLCGAWRAGLAAVIVAPALGSSVSSASDGLLAKCGDRCTGSSVRTQAMLQSRAKVNISRIVLEEAMKRLSMRFIGSTFSDRGEEEDHSVRTMPTATTSRYWDCRAPSCDPGAKMYPLASVPYQMFDWRTLVHAVVSEHIVKGNPCGQCFELAKDGAIVVAKVDGTCTCKEDPACCSPHFKLAVPGMGAGPNASDACASPETTIRYVGEDKKRQACSEWPSKDGSDCCTKVSTDWLLGSACTTFVSLNWDRPEVNFYEIPCPM
eukprot:TRINITY_DN9906_c0_g1_i3.p1 TRINITY_DN9906_c0_g1~~TRINITY_DN9906_c0_g1_i3.p1  ORF type:complete len:283 (-),score=45.31 TRINITY_DN9906_c0_g1_i3:45-893(-)